MQDNLAAIERLTREHEQALDMIGGIHEAVRGLELISKVVEN